MMNETAQVAVEGRKHAAFWEDLVDAYLSPRHLFERRRGGGSLPALLVLTIVVAALNVPVQLSMAGVMEPPVRVEVAGEEMTQAQMEQMQRISLVVGTIGSAIVTPVAILVTGVIVWALCGLLGIAMTAAAGVMIATYAAFPRVWSMATTMLQASVLDPDSVGEVSLGPARFLDSGSPPILTAVLGRLDVFTIWSTALLALGVTVAGRTERGRAWVVAAVVWVLGTLPAIVGMIAMSPGG